MKRKLIAFLGVICLIFAFSACEPDVQMDSYYGCSLHTWSSSSLTDMGVVQDYIQKNGGPWGTVVIKGKSEKANDATIKAQFDAAVSKMDFSTLGLDKGTSFVYSVTRSSSTPEGKGSVVASVQWPE